MGLVGSEKQGDLAQEGVESDEEEHVSIHITFAFAPHLSQPCLDKPGATHIPNMRREKGKIIKTQKEKFRVCGVGR